MPYNEKMADRIREFFYDKGVDFSEKKMFSGICFMVDEKMCCATHIDKRTGEDVLLCRIGDELYETALEEPDCIPMTFTGREMKGYVYALENGFRTAKGLTKWLQRCLDFNPKAKKSK